MIAGKVFFYDVSHCYVVFMLPLWDLETQKEIYHKQKSISVLDVRSLCQKKRAGKKSKITDLLILFSHQSKNNKVCCFKDLAKSTFTVKSSMYEQTNKKIHFRVRSGKFDNSKPRKVF